VALGLALAGCQSPPPRRAVSTHVSRPTAQANPSVAAATAAKPVPAAASATVLTAWSFSTVGNACEATAAGSLASVLIEVPDAQHVTLTIARPSTDQPAAPARRMHGHAQDVFVAFSGKAGSWRLPGKRQGRQSVTLSLPLSDRAVSDILAMLDGGQIEIDGTGTQWPILHLPVAGEPGRRWFECPRRRLLG
jgi:hypothetical protein